MVRVNTRVDWGQVSDLICAILEQMRENRVEIESAAAERGISSEQLISAAITEAVRERFFSRG